MCIGNIFHSGKGLSCVPCDTITAPLSLASISSSPYTGECWISACFEGVCFCEYNGAITRLWTHQGLRPSRKMRPRMAAVIYIGQPSSEMSLLLNSTLRAGGLPADALSLAPCSLCLYLRKTLPAVIEFGLCFSPVCVCCVYSVCQLLLLCEFKRQAYYACVHVRRTHFRKAQNTHTKLRCTRFS